MSRKEGSPLPSSIPLSGDRFITTPNVKQLDTRVTVRGNTDEIWKWFLHLGTVEEGGAGWLTPRLCDRFIPPLWRPLHTTKERDDTRELKIGDTMRDGPKDSKVEVVELNQDAWQRTKSMTLESRWLANNKRGEVHYTWQLLVKPTADFKGNEATTLLTRTRIENPKNPKRIKIYSWADGMAMKLVRKGLEERLER